MIALAMVLITIGALKAQNKYITKDGQISFFSGAPLEDIEAHNKQVVSILDLETGEVAVSMLMKAFEFEKSLMQEHFNENYVESDKYPKAQFTGKLQPAEAVKQLGSEPQRIAVMGELTIHGVTQKLNTMVEMSTVGGVIHVVGKFRVKVADHDIEVPSVVARNIAEIVEVSLNLKHKIYQ